jgi:hypothetical protein
MPTYTSVTSGDFNANTTWGAAAGLFPNADNDIFNIANGHVVTYNVNTALTNGFDNSTIFHTGVLIFAAGSRMRMNGILDIYGKFEMVPNTTLFIKGTDAEDHYIRTRNVANVQLILEGSPGHPETFTTASLACNTTVIPVDSSADFAVGDWISVHKSSTQKTNGTYSYLLETNDEGFIINHINGSNLHIREFTGPNTVLTAVSSNTLTVANAKIFRTYQKLVVNDTVASANIVSINYDTNEIVIDTNIWGSYVGNTIYTSGTLKVHANNEIVRKMGYYAPSAFAAAATTLTVGNVNGLNVGDSFCISYSANNSNFTALHNSNNQHTISAVNTTSKVITFSPGMVVGSAGGEHLFKLNRDCTIEVDSSSRSRPILSDDFTTNYFRRIKCKDVFFNNINKATNGTGAYFTGLFMRKEAANGVNTNGGFEIENCVFRFQADSFNRDQSGVRVNGHNGGTIRGCVVINAHSGIMAPWYRPDVYTFNNFVYSCRTGMRSEGSHGNTSNPTGGGSWEIAYNYINRSFDYWRIAAQITPGNLGIHHNRHYTSQVYALNIPACRGYAPIFQNEFKYFNYLRVESENSSIPLVYNFFESNSSIYTSHIDQQTSYRRTAGDALKSPNGGGHYDGYSLEHNYEIDAVERAGYNYIQTWDKNENAWKTFIRNDSSGISGHSQRTYVPPNVGVTVTCEVKLPPWYNGVAPVLDVRGNNVGQHYNGSNTVGVLNNPNVSERFINTYSTSALNAWQTLTVDVTPRPFGRHIAACVQANNANASEGWWEKNIKFTMSNTTPWTSIPTTEDNVIGGHQSPFVVQTSNKFRVGG